jgi:hypothetical protein
MKRKIYPIAILFMVGLLMPQSMRGNMFTERRGLFFGGYAEFSNYDLKNPVNSTDYSVREFSINALNGWFLSDNFAMGIKLGYGLSKSDDGVVIDNIEYTNLYKKHTYRIGLFMRNYFDLGKQVSFFVETAAVTGFGDIKLEKEEELLSTFTSTGDHFSLEVGMRPGIAFFFKNGFAVEATVGFIGFTYSKEKMKRGGQIEYETTTSGLDFSLKVNTLRIQVGAALYL